MAKPVEISALLKLQTTDFIPPQVQRFSTAAHDLHTLTSDLISFVGSAPPGGSRLQVYKCETGSIFFWRTGDFRGDQRGKIVAPSAGAGEERRKKKWLQSLSAPGDARAEGRCIPLWDGEVCGVWRGASLALCPPWCPKGHQRFPPTSPGATPGRQSCGPEPEQLLCCGVLPGQPWHCQPC